MEIQLNCPECRSFNVEIYKKDPNPFLNQHHYRCKDCGNIWRETLKILPDLNKNKKKELKMKIEKAKRNRIKYLKWGKIR